MKIVYLRDSFVLVSTVFRVVSRPCFLCIRNCQVALDFRVVCYQCLIEALIKASADCNSCRWQENVCGLPSHVGFALFEQSLF